MTATREAVVLPVTFITVALLGGLRIGAAVRLLPPPLVALILALLLLGTLARSGVLAPERLMSEHRSPLENISGAAVMLTLFAASAQVFNLLLPEYGLLHVCFAVCFFVQLVTTLAGVTGRNNLLRSLLVLLGCAFVLRFVVLEALYAPDSGIVKRVVTAIVEGASLGTVAYQPNSAATGYIAFFTVGLYMMGLVLLPARGRGLSPDAALQVRPRGEIVMLLLAAGLAVSACGGTAAAAKHDSAAASQHAPETDEGPIGSLARDNALSAARVWSRPATPVGQFDFSRNPPLPGGFDASDEVSCRFVAQRSNGTTPKFRCELPDGRVLKVKYGARNPELAAEVAATRLLAALGFGADQMYVVRSVKCAGCPPLPFHALKCHGLTGLSRVCFAGGIDYAEVRTFQAAVIERPTEGTAIEAMPDQGWSWYELDKIDPARGGSPRAEVDALRLLAVILAHWDNKGPNQRLICLPGGELPDGGCSRPMAMIQDLGATFGPLKLDLPNWRRTPVWSDRAACTVSMNSLPYKGATYPDHQISEAGRRLLAGLLDQLSDAQLADLFSASRIVSYDQVAAEARSAAAWVAAFKDKVRQVREGPACPA